MAKKNWRTRASKSFLNQGLSKYKRLSKSDIRKRGNQPDKPTNIERWLNVDSWKHKKPDRDPTLTDAEYEQLTDAKRQWLSRGSSAWHRGPFAPPAFRKPNRTPRTPGMHREQGEANQDPTEYRGRRRVDMGQEEENRPVTHPTTREEQFANLLAMGPHLDITIDEFFEMSSELNSEDLRELFYTHGITYNRRDGTRTATQVYNDWDSQAVSVTP